MTSMPAARSTFRRQHRLFAAFPPGKDVVLNGEQYPTPYHIYDGAILFIGGTADADAARTLLRGERLTPILNSAGRALMAVWVCDFTEANLDPHHELQLSIFAAFKPMPPVPAHPFAIFRLISAVPETMMICHGLWNNTPRVVQYNCELLGLTARLSDSRIELDTNGQRRRFDVRDAETGDPVASGNLRVPSRQDGAALRNLMGHLGLRGILGLMRSPFIQVPVVNPISERLPENQVARTYTKNDRQIVRRFDPQSDRLTIEHPAYAPLAFRPDFVQHGDGVRFVYLNPEPAVR